MKTEVILPAAGLGQRLNTSTPKQFIVIEELPLVIHTLKKIDAIDAIDGAILVVHQDHQEQFSNLVAKYGIQKVTAIVPGGASRCDSVECGLKFVAQDTDIVMVHDAARPFIDRDMVGRVIEAAIKSGAATVGVPVKPTIKIVDSQTQLVKETIDRAEAWEVQTPQAFKRDILIRAHAQEQKNVTDDAMLVEQLGESVEMVIGSYRNLKVTTPEDIIIAKAFLTEEEHED